MIQISPVELKIICRAAKLYCRKHPRTEYGTKEAADRLETWLYETQWETEFSRMLFIDELPF